MKRTITSITVNILPGTYEWQGKGYPMVDLKPEHSGTADAFSTSRKYIK